MELPYFQVDAFTERPFAGNPAGIVLLKEAIADELMQKIAAQINLSETAFLLQESDSLKLRWFTPKVEIALCGHATIGTAHALWESGLLRQEETAVFETKSSIIEVKKNNSWLEMKFPIFDSKQTTLPEELIDILAVNPVYTAEVFDRYLIELATEEEIRGLSPDFTRLQHFKKVLLTCKANEGTGFDFISRYFAPSIGVNEDPVTGTSHSCLAPYWGKKLNKTSMTAYQASQRGGTIKMQLKDNHVLLSGQAVTVIKGTLII